MGGGWKPRKDTPELVGEGQTPLGTLGSEDMHDQEYLTYLLETREAKINRLQEVYVAETSALNERVKLLTQQLCESQFENQ